jgi:chaperonin GroES
MNIRPLSDRIVVKRLSSSEDKVPRSGLYTPESATEKSQEGEVIAVGKGKRLEDGQIVPLGVEVGDRILFGTYSGSEIRIDGEEFLMMREDDVLGVLPSPALALTGTYGAAASHRVSRSVKRILPNGPDDFQVLNLRELVEDVVPNADEWLNTPNMQFNGRRPADLIGGQEEGSLRDLLLAIKYVAIS